jgi:hypothetical protein
VREKIALRIKEAGAIVRLDASLPTVTKNQPSRVSRSQKTTRVLRGQKTTRGSRRQKTS